MGVATTLTECGARDQAAAAARDGAVGREKGSRSSLCFLFRAHRWWSRMPVCPCLRSWCASASVFTLRFNSRWRWLHFRCRDQDQGCILFRLSRFGPAVQLRFHAADKSSLPDDYNHQIDDDEQFMNDDNQSPDQHSTHFLAPYFHAGPSAKEQESANPAPLAREKSHQCIESNDALGEAGDQPSPLTGPETACVVRLRPGADHGPAPGSPYLAKAASRPPWRSQVVRRPGQRVGQVTGALGTG
jgi:hypothetical protein